MKRKIGIIDCNNFYVSCERLFNPESIGRPTVVLSNNDGCVIARSQEAKDLGIKMGEPFFKSREFMDQHRFCVYSSNYNLYGDMSDRVMKVISEFGNDIEVYSIDEAFVDFSNILQEELNELKQAIDDNDLVEIADALCDIQYVLSGAILEFGLGALNCLFQKPTYYLGNLIMQNKLIHVNQFCSQGSFDKIG